MDGGSRVLGRAPDTVRTTLGCAPGVCIARPRPNGVDEVVRFVRLRSLAGARRTGAMVGVMTARHDPSRLPSAHRALIVAVLAAAQLAALAGCGAVPSESGSRSALTRGSAVQAFGVDVEGRVVRITAPPGMARDRPNPETEGVPWFEFGPEALLRDPGHDDARSMDYYAVANAVPVENHDDATASRAFAENTAEIQGLATVDTLEAWRAATRAGLAGERGRLPVSPKGTVLVERIESTPEGLVHLVSMNTEDGYGFLGAALLLVKGRVIHLTIIRRDPRTTADLAEVRTALTGWVRSFREANRGE